MKLKKKLPRYWLGTRKSNLGFLRSNMIYDTTNTTHRGIPIKSENNTFSNAFGNLTSNAYYPLLAYQSMTRVPAGTVLKGVDAINSAGGISNIISNGGTPTVSGALDLPFTTGVASTPEAAGLPTLIGATTGKTSTVINGLSNAASIAGIGISGYNVYNSFAHLNDILPLDQIANSADVNTVTTAGGNSYTEHGGLDSKSILNYQNQLDTQKKINLAINTAGLGASIGSLFTPIGGLIGAGAGLAIGSIANLLGFGDNEDEIKEAIRNQLDVFAMQDKQSRSTALDADTKAEFYDHAANGKRPVNKILPGFHNGTWSPYGLINAEATARVSNGEVVGNFEDGSAIRVPGLKNNKDTKLAALKDGDFVISNKYGLSDYAAATGDYAGALNLLEMLLGKMRNNRGYKCGKLPGFKEGWWQGALATLPHIMGYMSDLSQYNKAKNASVYAPDVYVENPEGIKAVNDLAQLRYDATPLYKAALRLLNQNNWDIRRQVGLGIGGRAIAQNALFDKYLDKVKEINAIENEKNTELAINSANATALLGARNQEAHINSNIHKHNWLQQAYGAKDYYASKYLDRTDTDFTKGVKELLSWNQYLDALGILNKQLNIYDRSVANDEYKYRHGLDVAKNGKLPRCEDGLVDTRSDTTRQGYNPNPIPWGAGLGPAGQGPMALLEGLEAASKISDNPYLLTGVAPSPMSKAKRIYDRARALNRLNNRKMLAGDLMGTPLWWEKYYDKALPFIGGANIGAAGYAGYRLLKDDAERVKRERSKKLKK